MLRAVKPRTARSKRALDARAPKEVEDPRTAIFVRGTHTGEKLNNVMKDLMALKRPNAISFSKKNAIHPFTDASSLEFWAQKNDAGFFIVGQSNKKRPDGLVLARMFDGRVLDMCELGVEGYVGIGDVSGPKATPGHTPLMHFASPLFDAHPRYIQLKSLLLDLFSAGEVRDAIHLKGIEHVISISVAPSPTTPTLNPSTDLSAPAPALPTIHLRTYTVSFQKSGARTPYTALAPHGPSLDLTLRRHAEAPAALMQLAMKRPKMKKTDVEKGLGKRKRNAEVDEVGDLRGRIHVPKQDLGALERGSKRMKGLKKRAGEGGQEG